ncbi:MAG TPA: DUF1127 domain-containing protein [Dongiaceae bacterium]|nr:DUF1127 domain-containing protein [Dongiaceae bacterium]
MKSIDFKANSTGCLTHTQPVPATTVTGRLQAGLSDWYHGWQKRRQYRKDMQHVAQFSTYLLRDIGLTSADLADSRRETHFASTDRVGRPG